MLTLFNKTALNNKTVIDNSSFFDRLVRYALTFILFIGFLANVEASATNDEQRQLLQLIEYIGVDYSAAVLEGKVIDAGEYREMQDFAAIIAEKSTSLNLAKPSFTQLAAALNAAVAGKQTVTKIQELTTQLKTMILSQSPQLSLPRSLLMPAEINSLFQTSCASCHGASGKGDGSFAKQLSPQPTDFTDMDRAMNRSLMGLYDIISSGLEGTAMPSFDQFTAKQRWSLAFEVGRMGFTSQSDLLLTETSNNLEKERDSLPVQEWIQFSPKEIIANRPEISVSSIQRLRAKPIWVFTRTQTPLAVSRSRLSAVLIAFKNKQLREANTLAVSAYLDGFELIETSLDAHNKPLRKEIEVALLGLRQILNKSTPLKKVESSVSNIVALLDQADDLLNKSSMSNATLFSASFIILLREGIEALLVVLALLTILVRSNKKEAIKYLHIGWVTALLAGVMTWYAAQHLITISGASREIMEGAAAMLAALVIFYVSFWMHNKSRAGQWQKYIKENVDHSLSNGTLWGISGLAFIAVYREIFETVLFYQSLMTQTMDSQLSIFALGFVLAILVLAIFAWLMIKFSVKLPISQFFSVTTYMLLILSFILMGKAISALQEAAVVGISSMPISFEVDWLGIRSTWQGVTAQMLILILSLGLILKPKLKRQAQGK